MRFDTESPSACPSVLLPTQIGVDNKDGYDDLTAFVDGVTSASGVRLWCLHARKAFLNGISPAQNRSVPPLKYPVVYSLKKDFPSLHVRGTEAAPCAPTLTATLSLGSAHHIISHHRTHLHPPPLPRPGDDQRRDRVSSGRKVPPRPGGRRRDARPRRLEGPNGAGVSGRGDLREGAAAAGGEGGGARGVRAVRGGTRWPLLCCERKF